MGEFGFINGCLLLNVPEYHPTTAFVVYICPKRHICVVPFGDGEIFRVEPQTSMSCCRCPEEPRLMAKWADCLHHRPPGPLVDYANYFPPKL